MCFTDSDEYPTVLDADIYIISVTIILLLKVMFILLFTKQTVTSVQLTICLLLKVVIFRLLNIQTFTQIQLRVLCY
jgi:hypothetical protein